MGQELSKAKDHQTLIRNTRMNRSNRSVRKTLRAINSGLEFPDSEELQLDAGENSIEESMSMMLGKVNIDSDARISMVVDDDEIDEAQHREEIIAQEFIREMRWKSSEELFEILESKTSPMSPIDSDEHQNDTFSDKKKSTEESEVSPVKRNAADSNARGFGQDSRGIQATFDIITLNDETPAWTSNKNMFSTNRSADQRSTAAWNDGFQDDMRSTRASLNRTHDGIASSLYLQRVLSHSFTAKSDVSSTSSARNSVTFDRQVSINHYFPDDRSFSGADEVDAPIHEVDLDAGVFVDVSDVVSEANSEDSNVEVIEDIYEVVETIEMTTTEEGEQQEVRDRSGEGTTEIQRSGESSEGSDKDFFTPQYTPALIKQSFSRLRTMQSLTLQPETDKNLQSGKGSNEMTSVIRYRMARDGSSQRSSGSKFFRHRSLSARVQDETQQNRSDERRLAPLTRWREQSVGDSQTARQLVEKVTSRSSCHVLNDVERMRSPTGSRRSENIGSPGVVSPSTFDSPLRQLSPRTSLATVASPQKSRLMENDDCARKLEQIPIVSIRNDRNSSSRSLAAGKPALKPISVTSPNHKRGSQQERASPSNNWKKLIVQTSRSSSWRKPLRGRTNSMRDSGKFDNRGYLDKKCNRSQEQSYSLPTSTSTEQLTAAIVKNDTAEATTEKDDLAKQAIARSGVAKATLMKNDAAKATFEKDEAKAALRSHSSIEGDNRSLKGLSMLASLTKLGKSSSTKSRPSTSTHENAETNNKRSKLIRDNLKLTSTFFVPFRQEQTDKPSTPMSRSFAGSLSTDPQNSLFRRRRKSDHSH